MATAAEPRVRDPRDYVDPEVWAREVQLLMRDHPFDEVMATRLFHAAVSYLITAIDKWGQGLEMCCGRTVDIVVHTFILDTRNYRQFCHRHFDGSSWSTSRRSTSSTTAASSGRRRSSPTTASRSTGSCGRPTTASAGPAGPEETVTEPATAGRGPATL
ncbi:hypothetical protein ACFV2V_18905 [Streptomyces sp. NPDC059698]|uniref:hypothetical protein n=1 Tax=Streptomyces TaxID=1883 RepID=UPI000B1A49DD